MKNLYLSVLVLGIFTLTSYAQNYNCLQPGARPYFINGNGYLRSMRIDSVRASGSDTIFYPYHTPRGTYTAYTSIPLDSAGGSWLGKNVIKTTDGTFLFGNMWSDTVVIKTQANPGDSWTFYRDSTQLSYKATLITIDTMTILGILDSVKTIVIEADSAGLLHAADAVNNFRIILSKNYGFVRVFDLYTFPYRVLADSISIIPGTDYYMDLVLGNLASGDATPPHRPDTINSIFQLVPLHNPTMEELYNFPVGEVLEFRDIKNLSTSYGTQVTLDTILSKTVTPASVTYTTSGLSIQTTTTCCPSATSTNTESSFLPAYDTSSLIDKSVLPEEWNSNYFYHYFPATLADTNDACPALTYIVDVNNINYSSGFVTYQTIDFAAQIGNYTTTYSIGYGAAVISATSYVPSGTEYGQYVYIKNGDSVCGAYSNPLAVNQITLPVTHLDIAPNPAHEELTVSASGMVTDVVISDMMGQVVYRNSQCNSDKVLIDIASLAPGIYLLKANNAVVRKFVKE